MRSKKAAVWYYIILLGFILGLAAFYYYNAKFDPPEQSKIGNEIFKQVIERDLEISSIQYYIQESAKLSLIDSIYSIARKGGFYDNSPCGSYQGIPLLQTKDKGMDECTPNIEKELVSEFLSYLGSYLKNYKEDIGASHEYGVAIKFNKNM